MSWIATVAVVLSGWTRSGIAGGGVVARSGVDYVVKLTAGDGEHARRTARVSRAFAAGTSLATVVQHIAEAMEVGIGNAVEALRGASFSAGGDVYADGTALHGGAASPQSKTAREQAT